MIQEQAFILFMHACTVKLTSVALYMFKITKDINIAYVGRSQIEDPREDAGGLSREYGLRITSVSQKATKWGGGGGGSESPYKKGGPVSV